MDLQYIYAQISIEDDEIFITYFCTITGRFFGTCSILLITYSNHTFAIDFQIQTKKKGHTRIP